MLRYSLRHLTIESEPVYFETGAGDVLGFLKYVGKDNRRVYRIRLDRSNSYDLPEKYPLSWRPVNPDTWPDVLPDPMSRVKEAEHVTEQPRVAPERLSDLEWWCHPDFRLGQPGEPPVSLRECEARILRAFRTNDYLSKLDRPGYASAWPGDLMVAARCVAELLKTAKSGKLPFLNGDDYHDIHVDRSDLRALPARWTPTRRDIGDAEPGHAFSWLPKLNKSESAIFHWRTDTPPYSWAQISEFDGRARQVLQRRYKRIIEAAFKRATA